MGPFTGRPHWYGVINVDAPRCGSFTAASDIESLAPGTSPIDSKNEPDVATDIDAGRNVYLQHGLEEIPQLVIRTLANGPAR